MRRFQVPSRWTQRTPPGQLSAPLRKICCTTAWHFGVPCFSRVALEVDLPHHVSAVSMLRTARARLAHGTGLLWESPLLLIIAKVTMIINNHSATCHCACGFVLGAFARGLGVHTGGVHPESTTAVPSLGLRLHAGSEHRPDAPQEAAKDTAHSASFRLYHLKGSKGTPTIAKCMTKIGECLHRSCAAPGKARFDLSSRGAQ